MSANPVRTDAAGVADKMTLGLEVPFGVPAMPMPPHKETLSAPENGVTIPANAVNGPRTRRGLGAREAEISIGTGLIVTRIN
jgi:hypothetical protein